MGRLIIDPEFRDKIPPLTEDEFIQLEENILSDGAVVSPLIVWDSVILDGHNRYEIIRKHPELVYAVHEMQFSNRYEALSWICRNQLGRRNLTPQQKKYLIGQRYEAEKQADAFHGNQHTLLDESGGDKICHHQNGKTRKRIAEEVGLSQGYVQNASSYAKGVDAAEEALPGIKQEILTGAIKPTETAVAAIAKAEPRERPKLAAALKNPKTAGRITPKSHSLFTISHRRSIPDGKPSGRSRKYPQKWNGPSPRSRRTASSVPWTARSFLLLRYATTSSSSIHGSCPTPITNMK